MACFMGETFANSTIIRGASTAGSEGVFYFRGTTAGYPGNPGLQKIGVTPASTDPIVATCFATEAEKYGQGVVYIASSKELSGISIGEGNVLASLESEVAINTAPLEFVQRSGITITAEQARMILKDMGINVPSRINNPTDLQNILKSLPRLNDEQISAFTTIASQIAGVNQ